MIRQTQVFDPSSTNLGSITLIAARLWTRTLFAKELGLQFSWGGQEMFTQIFNAFTDHDESTKKLAKPSLSTMTFAQIQQQPNEAVVSQPFSRCFKRFQSVF
jgi:hypothetical protein